MRQGLHLMNCDMTSQSQPGGSCNPKTKKRVASNDDTSASELSTFKTVESRATKKHKKQAARRRTTSNSNDTAAPVSSDDCVFCGGANAKDVSIDCEQCGLSYHLQCCGFPTQHHIIALVFLKFLHWSCDACRLASEERLDGLEKIVKSQDMKI